MVRLFDLHTRAVDAGEMTSRLELQRRVEVMLPNGDVQRAWVPYATGWCAVRTSSAREVIAAEQSWPQSRRALRTHWVDGVSIADRAVVDGVPFDVIGSSDPDGRRALIDIYVTECSHDG